MKTATVVGVVVGAVGVVGAIRYRKEIGAGCARISDSVADMFSKKKAAEVVVAPVAEVVAPVAEVVAPVAEVVAPVADVVAPVADVVEVSVVDSLPLVADVLDAIMVDIVVEAVATPEVTVIVEKTITELENLEKVLEQGSQTPEEVAAATQQAILELANEIGEELMQQTEAVQEPVPVMVTEEVIKGLEKSMSSLPTQPYKTYKKHHKQQRHNQRR